MYTKIAAMVVALALSSLALPSLAQGTGWETIGNGGGGSWQTAARQQEKDNMAGAVQQQQGQNQIAGVENDADQVAQQARIERWQEAGMPQDQMRQGINPGLISQMRASMRQAGGIGCYRPAWQMAPTSAPDNMDAAYGRPRMFAELMHQHAVLTQPYRVGGN